jgi:UDP-N-acetylmuramyl pentapeptide synthase
MPFEVPLSFVLGGGLTVVSIFSQVQLWQRKEYRWDRLRSLLFSPESRGLVWPWIVLGVALTDAAWIAFLRGNDDAANIIGYAALAAFVAHHAMRIRSRGLLRPEWTIKAASIVALSLVVVAWYLKAYFYSSELVGLQWATLLLFLPAMVAMLVGVVNIPFAWKKIQIIERATAIRHNRPHLTVIGITGSYGKTSAKYFLGQLLQTGFSGVVSTQHHYNSHIGVAQEMLHELKPETKYYIAEMGAYRLGEIAALAKLAQPQISIITAIGNQHIDLFGSQENIASGKWELAQHTAAHGTLVLNADNVLLQEKAKGEKRKIVWYSVKQKAEVYVTDTIVNARDIAATVHIGQFSRAVTIPLVSEGLLSAALAAVAGAYAVGMKPEDICTALASLKPFSRTMELVRGKNGATLIDDSYSANEQGVLNALQQLKLFTETDKRVVLLPLIELGTDAPDTHERIGRALQETGAKVYVAGTSYRRELSVAGNVQFMTDAKALAAAVSQHLSSDSVVLLEGRIPELVRRTVL